MTEGDKGRASRADIRVCAAGLRAFLIAYGGVDGLAREIERLASCESGSVRVRACQVALDALLHLEHARAEMAREEEERERARQARAEWRSRERHRERARRQSRARSRRKRVKESRERESEEEARSARTKKRPARRKVSQGKGKRRVREI